VEHKCERLKREIDEIEAEKYNSARLLQEISDQITTMRKTLDQHQLSCKEQSLELTKIQLQKVRLEGLVDNFQNNDEGYVKIRNTAEEKVVNILSNKKTLLKLALLSLTESMRKNPDKFNAFIFCDNESPSSTTQTRDYSQYYDTVHYGQQQQQYPSHDYISMLLEESEKLYDKLAKELVDEIISDYASSISTSLSLLRLC
jgi:small-conductance mechanosensitive channel